MSLFHMSEHPPNLICEVSGAFCISGRVLKLSFSRYRILVCNRKLKYYLILQLMNIELCDDIKLCYLNIFWILCKYMIFERI